MDEPTYATIIDLRRQPVHPVDVINTLLQVPNRIRSDHWRGERTNHDQDTKVICDFAPRHRLARVEISSPRGKTPTQILRVGEIDRIVLELERHRVRFISVKKRIQVVVSAFGGHLLMTGRDPRRDELPDEPTYINMSGILDRSSFRATNHADRWTGRLRVKVRGDEVAYIPLLASGHRARAAAHYQPDTPVILVVQQLRHIYQEGPDLSFQWYLIHDIIQPGDSLIA